MEDAAVAATRLGHVTFLIRKLTIRHVTALGGGSQGFCDDSTKAFAIKRATMAEGGSKIV